MINELSSVLVPILIPVFIIGSPYLIVAVPVQLLVITPISWIISIF